MSDLHKLLEEKAHQYNQPDFITSDPIQIPHRFSRLQDIEIMGFWAATLAWGQRKTIIQNCLRLIEYMDGEPYLFVKNHSLADRKPFLSFKHRTFQPTDALYFLEFLQYFYQKNDSLETAFVPKGLSGVLEVGQALERFHRCFFSLPDIPTRTRKHVARPSTKSACKRLNMFLRWMVRTDDAGVDFGCWKQIQPAQLICPLDVHVGRVARRLGLLTRKQDDWQAALELTQALRQFDPLDPVRYDFALFGMGLESTGRV
ncbi:MAG: TIGR02757 family protein [Bernardetiaceae bacterium]